MIVVSMNDFLGNPAQYVEQAHHTAVLIENKGSDPIKLSVRKSFFHIITRIFSAKARRTARDRKDIEYINANAERLNREAEENLEFQADLWEKKALRIALAIE